MTCVLLSIQPRWARKIYQYCKRTEIRKALPRLPAKLYFYESGTHTITGEALCTEALVSSETAHPPPELLESACLSARQLRDYADGKPIVALALREVVRYAQPIAWRKRPPQSWCYLPGPPGED